MRASFSRRTRISSDSGTSDSSSFAKVREFYLVASARCSVVLLYSVPSTEHYAPGGGVGGGVCCAGFVTGGAGGHAILGLRLNSNSAAHTYLTNDMPMKDLLARWQKSDGSFRSRQLLIGWDNVPMHRWGQSQMFRALAFYLRETSATEVRWQRSEISRKAAGATDVSGQKIMISE